MCTCVLVCAEAMIIDPLDSPDLDTHARLQAAFYYTIHHISQSYYPYHIVYIYTYIYNMSVCAQTMSFQTMQNKTNKILYHSHMNGREEMGNHLGYLFLIEQTETNLEIEA